MYHPPLCVALPRGGSGGSGLLGGARRFPLCPHFARRRRRSPSVARRQLLVSKPRRACRLGVGGWAGRAEHFLLVDDDKKNTGACVPPLLAGLGSVGVGLAWARPAAATGVGHPIQPNHIRVAVARLPGQALGRRCRPACFSRRLAGRSALFGPAASAGRLREGSRLLCRACAPCCCNETSEPRGRVSRWTRREGESATRRAPR